MKYAKGTTVRFWTGLREGQGRIGQISYDGIYQIGGTPGVYIGPVNGRAVGFVALTHVELERHGGIEGGEKG